MTLPALADLDGWLAGREAGVPALRPGCEKRVAWAGAPGRRTPWAVVYVHGFSASRRELSPYPEEVARALGANLFATRLSGHGQDGAAMARATLRDWRADVAESFALGRALGERLLVLSCSTGGTLVTLALAGGEAAAGTVLVSPNYGVRERRLQMMLDAPLSGRIAPFLMPGEVGGPMQDASGVWTPSYPVQAYVPMAQAVRAVRRADLEGIGTPALFAYSDADAIVDAGLTAAVLRRWGGPARRLALEPGPGDDPKAHVLAGDLKSPGLTAPLVEATLDWARGLPAR